MFTTSRQSHKITFSTSRAVIVALVAAILTTVQPAQATGTIVVNTPAQVTSTINTTTDVTGVNVTGLAAGETYSVTVALASGPTGSELRLDTATALTVTPAFGYSNSSFASFSTITFSGLETEVNNLLATLKYRSGANAGTPMITVSATLFASSDIAYSSVTGHYYKSFGPSNYPADQSTWGTNSNGEKAPTWGQARSAAMAETYLGQQGYLVTITSDAEQNFVNTKVNASNIWIGATDQVTEGTWQWDVTGGSPDTATAVPGTISSSPFAKWCSAEPNNSGGGAGEDHAVTKWNGDNCWNDLASTNISTINGYVVEFGQSTSGPSGEFTGAVSQSISVKYTQTISINNSSVIRNVTNTLAATTPLTSNSVTFAVSESGAAGCSLSGGNQLTSSGVFGDTCTVVATVAGDSTFFSASETKTLAIGAATPGLIGDYALTFNGTTQYANSPAQIIPASGPFTVEAWVNPSNAADSNNRQIISQGGAGQHFYMKRILGKLVFKADGFASEVTCGTFPQNQWSHLAVTVNGTNAKCYLNGNLQMNVTVNAATTIGSGFHTGAYSADLVAGLSKFAGKIDEVRVWGVERTQSQIAATRNVAPTLSDSNLRAYYDFNEGSGNLVNNRATGAGSVASANLAVVRAPLWEALTTQQNASSYTVTTFKRTYITSAGGWTIPAGVTSLDLFVLGGGGGGGVDAGSGGAGGGIHMRTGEVVTAGSLMSVVVGTGGSAGIYNTSATTTAGESSTVTIGSSSFIGGGGEGGATGTSNSSQPAAAVGGLGVGTGGDNYQGSSGGQGRGWNTGVGPGLGLAGQDGVLIATNLLGETNVRYAAGGAGGANMNSSTNIAVVNGGLGGGGNSGGYIAPNYTIPTDGAAGTGSGGGAGLANAIDTTKKSSAAGGSGIVMIRYQGPVFSSTTPVFPNTSLGQSSSAQTIMVTNLGTANLIFPSNAIQISGVNSSEFSLQSENCSSRSIAPNETCTASVVFSPTAFGDRNATLFFESNAFGTFQGVDLNGSSPSPAPTYGTPTATPSGFTVQITNYSNANSYDNVTATVGTAVISTSGLLTVTGLAASTASTVTVTASLSGQSDSSSITGTSRGLGPVFGAVVSNATGYTVRITNYSGSYTWDTVTVSAGTAAIDGTGLLSVAGLSAGESSTVEVRMVSTGFTATEPVTGTALNEATPCPKTSCVFTNGRLRFGNGNENSINGAGNFQQPWYYSSTLSTYRPLTYSSYPLNLVIGTGTGNSGNWTGSTPVNASGSAIGGINMTDIRVDYSRFTVTESTTSVAKGYGVISVSGYFAINGDSIRVEHTYSLGQNDGFVKTVTTFTNVNASTLSNTSVWVGTQDDWVGNTDSPTKTRGNLTGNGGALVPISTASQAAQALEIKTSAEGVLFYSTTPGANTIIGPRYGYANMLANSPAASPITSTGDQTYAAVFDFGNLAAGAAKTVTWFYAGGSLAQLAEITQAVAGAAASAPAAPLVDRGNGSVSVHWLVPQSDDPITNYTIRYSSDNGANWTVLTRAADTSTSWSEITGLNNSLTYLFQVAAITTFGGTDTTGNWSASSDPYVLGSPPTAPVITSVTAIGAGVALDFNPASSPTGPLINYEYRLGSSDTWTAFATPILETVTAVVGAPIPTVPAGGSYSFQLRARNSFGAGPVALSTPFLTLPTFSDTSVALMTVGSAYSDVLAAGSNIDSYTITSGSLPEGITLDPTNGRLSGTPTYGTSYSFAVTATNATGSVSATIAGTINYPAGVPIWRGNSLPTITSGAAISIATLADSATVFSIVGSLPAGLTLETATGTISGTPSAAGPYSFVIRATNSNGYRAQRFSGSIEPGGGIPYNGPSWGSIPTLNFTQGAQASSSVFARGATSYRIIDGSLPAGLTFNPLTGAITGSPTGSGPYTFTVLATNIGGSTAATFTGNIAKSMEVIPNPPKDTVVDSKEKLAPVVPSVLPKPGNIQVLVDGVASVATIVPNASKNGLEVQTKGWTLTLAATTPAGTVAPLNASSQIIFKKTYGVEVTGSGFAPNTDVSTYIFSTPVLLGTVRTDAKGSFKANLPLPIGIEVGGHTLQINGISPANEVRSASVGILVEDQKVINPPSGAGASIGANQVVVSFAYGKYYLSPSQLTKLKKLLVKKGQIVKVAGYAQKTNTQQDIAVSLDRAIEVRKAFLKINATAKVTIIGMGNKSQKLCAQFKNKCAVATVGK